MTQLHALVVYVPESHLEEVLLAIGDAGAGRIGDYSHCFYTSPGTGRFTPQPGAQPFVGAVGIALTASQGPVGGICAGPAATLSLELWAGRLRRGEYYRALAAAIRTGALIGLIAVVVFIRSRSWG